VGTRFWSLGGLALVTACGGRTLGDQTAPAADGGGGGGAASGGGAGVAGHVTTNPAGGGFAGGIGALPNAACGEATLDVPWPVIAGCLGPPSSITALRCAFPRQLDQPSYGPFVACCPPDAPYGCPNGTPQSCFPNAALAASACGNDNCQHCVPY
jgi:hypothetical protein